ncbi:hypothetical protein [Asticcacaulis solisilvae]|uniref:hypothetical protein n=1 Tax=Asticcacaulis solisilvae TaxID=1217274 RepID=UPI003FD7361C
MSIDNTAGRPLYVDTVEDLLSRFFAGLTAPAHTSRAIAALCVALAPMETLRAGDQEQLLAHLDTVLAAYKDGRLDQDKVMTTAIALAENAYNGDRVAMNIG